MSAIWGMISFYNSIETQINSKMCNIYEAKCRLDKIQTVMQPSVYMACGLQYVTAQAEHEKLPIYDKENGCFFTADCILDNREELMDRLGIRDKELPDGQIMYLAYRKWDMKCLEYFRGLFSMAVYNQRERVLYLAADQVSARCLYYYRRDSLVAFSTLLEPIKACFSDISMNDLYMKDFLTAPGMMPNIVSTETPYEGIFKLNPGSYLKITPEEVQEISYWNPGIPLSDCNCRTSKEYGKYFRKLYEECVRDALRTNGKVGIAMSSGLDSASVGVLAADLLHKDNKCLYSYTYVPSEGGMTDKNRNNVLDEQQDVMKIVENYSNIHPHFWNNHGKNCYVEIEKCLDIMEIPFKASVNLPNLCEIYEQAGREGCKIVLSGQAGNSTVSHGYIDDVLYDLYHKKKYVTFFKYLNRYSMTVKESRKAALRGCRRYFHYADEEREKKELGYQLGNPFLQESVLEGYPLKERYAKGEIFLLSKIPVEQTMYQSYLYKKALYTYLGELETKLGLAYHVVLRDPTKDIRLLQFCYHLPYQYFAYQGTPRWLIRGNMQDMLPESLLQDWMRYGVQNSDWYLRMLRDWDVLCPEIRKCLADMKIKRYLDEEMVEAFLKNIHEEEPEKAEYLLQCILFLCTAAMYVHK